MDNNLTPSEKSAEAIRVAKMYYFTGMTTEAIARELHVSRSTVSRLLSYAKREGFVQILIHDPQAHPQQLEQKIVREFKILRAHIVPVPERLGEAEWLERVAQYAANYLNSLLASNMILGIAWGTTTSAISKHLLPKRTFQMQVVQLNGAGNTQTMGIEYASEIILRFAQNYQASPHLFPVPAFFDRAETKRALWEESSIRRILDLQNQADYLLYSIGAVNAGIPSHVYSGIYLTAKDQDELAAAGVVGDIATVFFREDGSFDGIAINQRASGPDLSFFQRKHGLCVVSGLAKVRGLVAALRGHFITELILDEPSARKLVDEYIKT